MVTVLFRRPAQHGCFPTGTQEHGAVGIAFFDLADGHGNLGARVDALHQFLVEAVDFSAQGVELSGFGLLLPVFLGGHGGGSPGPAPC